MIARFFVVIFKPIGSFVVIKIYNNKKIIYTEYTCRKEKIKIWKWKSIDNAASRWLISRIFCLLPATVSMDVGWVDMSDLVYDTPSQKLEAVSLA